MSLAQLANGCSCLSLWENERACLRSTASRARECRVAAGEGGHGARAPEARPSPPPSPPFGHSLRSGRGRKKGASPKGRGAVAISARFNRAVILSAAKNLVSLLHEAGSFTAFRMTTPKPACAVITWSFFRHNGRSPYFFCFRDHDPDFIHRFIQRICELSRS